MRKNSFAFHEFLSVLSAAFIVLTLVFSVHSEQLKISKKSVYNILFEIIYIF